jgi:hypothetical protein
VRVAADALTAGGGGRRPVRAQRETGTAGLRYVAGLWAQAGWNLVPLVACAALAWPAWRAAGAEDDRALLRTLVAAAAGSLLLLTTLFKHGSYLTVVLVAEPPLLCLAAVGVVAAARERAGRRLALVGAAALLALAEVGSLLASPGSPGLFTRPGAASGPGWALSPAQVRQEVAALRACPRDVASDGPPYLAFAAGRRIVGDQPDQFIVENAPILVRFRRAAERDRPRCG